MSFPDEVGETQILAALLGIAGMVGDLTDTDEMLESVVRVAPSLLHVDRCAVLLYDETARELRTATSFGPGAHGTPLAGLRILESDMPRLSQRLLKLHLPALVKPDSRDASLPTEVTQRVGLRAALLVPLVCRGRVLGILWLDHSAQVHYFTSQEINIAQGIATSLAVALDGTFRREALEVERRRFAALAAALADGVIALDRDLRIVELDAGAEGLLGWHTAEVLGRRAHEVFEVTDAEPGSVWAGKAAIPGTPSRVLPFRARDGTRIPCEVLTLPVRNAAGDALQFLYVLRRAPVVAATALSEARD